MAIGSALGVTLAATPTAAERASAETLGRAAAPVVYHLYLDQDRTRMARAGRSIELSMRAALSSLTALKTADGRTVELRLLLRDHRKNIYRSKIHMDEFVSDPRALALVAGKESPPLIRHRSFINTNEILTLAPWSAGAPITRAAVGEANWVFRLSLDDRKAGDFMAGHSAARCEQIHLAMIDNRWGAGAAQSIQDGLARRERRASSTVWPPWAVDRTGAFERLARLGLSQRDCVLLVAPARESVAAAQALLKLSDEDRPRLISHWGFTGSDFPERVPAEQRRALRLEFLQTCHDLFTPRPTLRTALERLRRISDGKVERAEDIPAPAGFANAYDLGLVLAAALRQSELTGDAREDRRRLRAALLHLKEPVQGLIPRYDRPFSPYAPDRPDAHEALGAEDICAARFDTRDVIRVIPPVDGDATGSLP